MPGHCRRRQCRQRGPCRPRRRRAPSSSIRSGCLFHPGRIEPVRGQPGRVLDRPATAPPRGAGLGAMPSAKTPRGRSSVARTRPGSRGNAASPGRRRSPDGTPWRAAGRRASPRRSTRPAPGRAFDTDQRSGLAGLARCKRMPGAGGRSRCSLPRTSRRALCLARDAFGVIGAEKGDGARARRGGGEARGRAGGARGVGRNVEARTDLQPGASLDDAPTGITASRSPWTAGRTCDPSAAARGSARARTTRRPRLPAGRADPP